MPKKRAMFKSTERRTVAAWPALARIVQVNVGLTDARSLDGDELVSKLVALGANEVVRDEPGQHARTRPLASTRRRISVIAASGQSALAAFSIGAMATLVA